MNKILVYGMGNGAKKFLKNVYEVEDVNIVGITDSFETGGERFGEIPVFCIEDALKLDFDWLVICSVYIKEIKENLIKNFGITEKVINTQDFC